IAEADDHDGHAHEHALEHAIHHRDLFGLSGGPLHGHRGGGRTETPLSQAERDDTSKPKLRNLDLCMTHQIDYARRISEAALQKSFGGASAEIARSDILASLYDFAAHVVHPSTAKSKTLLLASDMLENSSLSSFYSQRSVRKLDPAAELRKVRDKGLIPDLTGVRIFVV